MNPPRLRRRPDGGIVFDQLTPAFLHVLHELPELLGTDQPDVVRQRLYPPPTDDDQTNQEWERLVHPDLFSLIASAREIVLKDLQSLATSEPSDDAPLGIWSFAIPGAHIPGWLSALNAGRLALGALHELDEADMQDELAFEEFSDKQFAIVKIYLLSWLQQMLIEEQGDYPPQTLDEIEQWEQHLNADDDGPNDAPQDDNPEDADPSGDGDEPDSDDDEPETPG